MKGRDKFDGRRFESGHLHQNNPHTGVSLVSTCFEGDLEHTGMILSLSGQIINADENLRMAA